eukprot:TRINITY_DN29823_c0_g1_i1.p1 TRINITY_DN29823_c0_g1~~TRINITY_DN29823_c0_g1_i1.p1  ORF type:complete len:462 (-),score=57.31 TRINITY_DN29823_c0_g1_i1:241-1626(-)
MSETECKGYALVSARDTSRREINAASDDARNPDGERNDERRITIPRPSPDADPEFQLACAKFVGGLVSTKETIQVENDSVYGAALVIPQVARSMACPRELLLMSFTSIFYLSLTIILHVLLLTYIDKEEKVFDKFGGEMYLCDLGVNLEQCTEDPDFPGCMGPGGTKMSAPRLYDWSTWVTRNFVRDSFKAMFPHMTLDEINAKVDPGEYGIESYWCRVICVFIFVLTLVPEAKLCIEMANCLWRVPTENASWVEVNEGASDLIDSLRIKIAGMSCGWKLSNAIFVLMPKTILLVWTAKAGVFFLMETAGIDAIIVNSVALGFLLSLDELITEALLSTSTRLVLEKCEGFTLGEDPGKQTDEHMIDVFYEQQKVSGCFSWVLLIRDFVFRHTLSIWIVALIFVGFVGSYYLTSCQLDEGRWVSKPLHLPNSLKFNVINAALSFLFPVPVEEKASWTMPETL